MIAAVQKRFTSDPADPAKSSSAEGKRKAAPFSGSYSTDQKEAERVNAEAEKMAGVGPHGREEIRKRVVGQK